MDFAQVRTPESDGKKQRPSPQKTGSSNMLDLYWFGVSIRFACPACHRTSAEQLALSTDRSDPASINQVINCQKLACQLCKVPLPSGTEVNVRVERSI
jgi:hypothetical protein